MGKQVYLQRLKDGKGLLAQVAGSSRTQENVRVRLFGDTAVVTGISNYKSSAQQLRINYTSVWVKLKGQWQVVAAHSSVPPAQ